MSKKKNKKSGQLGLTKAKQVRNEIIRVEDVSEDEPSGKEKPLKPWQKLLSHISDVDKRDALIQNIKHNSKETKKFLTSVVVGLGEISDAITEADFGDKNDSR
tara:strand:- start:61 stop:369 length:309 start_codon:yes stop_codon:yes gene_type:complete